jgi:hypothetical protein
VPHAVLCVPAGFTDKVSRESFAHRPIIWFTDSLAFKLPCQASSICSKGFWKTSGGRRPVLV